VCKAAIHSGALTDNGGDVIVVIANGEDEY